MSDNSSSSRRPVGKAGDPRQPERFSNLLASRPEREGGSTILASLTSLVLHGLIIAGLVWATLAIGEEVVAEEQITLIEIPPETPPPPPPPPPMEEVTPPPPDVADVRGFQTLAPPEFVPPVIPPPAVGPTIDEADFSGEGVEGGTAEGRVVTAEDLDAAPTFTPYTVAPQLRNREEVARALVRYYPPLLKDAGIGGTVLVWFFIDEQGSVVKTQIKESSGHEGLDEAALKVGDIMEFSPALNRDQKVKVWVALPIVFQVR